MKKINTYIAIGIGTFFLFLLLMILLNVDKNNITGSGLVGLSHFNNIVKYEYKENLDKMSDILLYLSFIPVIFAGILGIIQLVKRKSLFKVDKELIVFAIALVLTIILWLLFDKALKINVRPLNPNEGSFPSTHVLITIFFSLSCFNLLKRYNTGSKVFNYIALGIAIVISIIVVITRVASGMHYITDVIGGIFLGLSFYFLTFGIIDLIKINNKQ